MTHWYRRQLTRECVRPLALPVALLSLACADATSLRHLTMTRERSEQTPRLAMSELGTRRTFGQTPTPIAPASLDTIRAGQTSPVVVDSTRSTEASAAPRSAGRDSVPERIVDASMPSPSINTPATFVFGRSNPVLTCTVLRACLIELEAGEALVEEPIAGDQARWIIAHARTGQGGTSSLVIVKPKACDIATNLVLSTERRIYDLDLVSPRCRGGDANPKQQYTRHIRFEYPPDSSRRVERQVARRDQTTSPAFSIDSIRVQEAALPLNPADAVRLNRNYRVTHERRGPFGLFGEKAVDFPWTPTAISDDGAHVYLIMPREAHRHAAPVLYALEGDASRTMMNFTMRDSVIVTDRIFRRGILVLTAGNREQSLEFENASWGKAIELTRRP